MSANKKTRADSVLGRQTPERQEQIAEHARTHTLAETAAWLKSDGIKLSSQNLSSWLSDYRLHCIFRHSEAKAGQFKEWLAKSMPSLSEEQLDQRAALMFQFQAVESGDAETWLAIASARQKAKTEQVKSEQREKVIAQNDRKLALLEKKAAQADSAKGILQDAELSEAEKKARMHELFGLR